MSSTHSSQSTTPFSSATKAASASITSSSTVPISASQSVPTSSATSSGGGSSSGLGGSSSLYLYTFLATLVLLLGVSGAIVIRSYVMRRRHQALVEEAIRNGTWVPSAFNGGRRGGRRDVGEKPTMWEAWVDQDREMMDSSESEIGSMSGAKGKDNGGFGWEDLLPISATYLNLPPSKPTAPSTSTRGHTTPRSRIPWRRSPMAQSPPSSPAPPSAATSSSALNLPTTLAPTVTPADRPSTSSPMPTLRLTILIAMPAPPTSSTQSHEDEGPPVIELGVVDVGVVSARSEELVHHGQGGGEGRRVPA